MFRYLGIIFRNMNFTDKYEFLNFKKTLTAKYTKFDNEMTLFRLNITFGYPKVRPLLMEHICTFQPVNFFSIFKLF